MRPGSAFLGGNKEILCHDFSSQSLGTPGMAQRSAVSYLGGQKISDRLGPAVCPQALGVHSPGRAVVRLQLCFEECESTRRLSLTPRREEDASPGCSRGEMLAIAQQRNLGTEGRLF